MEQATLFSTEVHTLGSEEIGQEFEIRIAHPVPSPNPGGSASPPRGDFPVLYVLAVMTRGLRSVVGPGV